MCKNEVKKEPKNGVREYRIHIAICILIAVVAFGINWKIEADRSRTYVVSESTHTLLKEVTEARIEGNAFVLSGWGFDTNYYNKESSSELILQDTETGETLWPKMQKNQEPVLIAEKYTNGEDYSTAGFTGTLESNALKGGNVYEILLRYTSAYIDENGREQFYIRTVTTDKFIYENKIIEYNPKTFTGLEIMGTELEKELEGAELFHYFPEGMWIYCKGRKLYYVVKSSVIGERTDSLCPMHCYIRNVQDVPEEGQKYGFRNSDFNFDLQSVSFTGIEGYKVAVVDLMSDQITYLRTGLYYTDSGWVLQKMKQLN